MIASLLFAAMAALPSVSTSSTATMAIAFGPTPKLLMTPTWTHQDRRAVEASAVAAFSSELREVARAEFRRRRWDVVEPKLTQQQWSSCSAECYSRLAASVGASHWLASLLVQTDAHRCAARAIVYDIRGEEIMRRLDVQIVPCSADRLLAAAYRLGLDMSEGARSAPKITVNLTPRSIVDLDIPDIDDIDRTQTLTSTTEKRPMTLPLALENYGRRHMVLIPVTGTYGQMIIVRNNAAITECDALRAASRQVPSELRNWCEGNYWEWAWLGAGGGALISYAASSSMVEGEFGGVFFYSLGIATVIGSGIAALAFNENAKDPHEGRHQMSTEDLFTLVEEANRDLRRQLGLSESEVEVAGYRR